MRDAVAGVGDAGFWAVPLCRDHRSRLQRMRSYDFDEFAPLQIGKGFVHIGTQCFNVGVVFFG